MNYLISLSDKQALLVPAKEADRPLIVFNDNYNDESALLNALDALGAPDHNLLIVGGLNWNHDLTPWYCPPIFPEGEPYTGGADEYLELLITEILPKAKEMITGTPPFIGIAGYSLAGLFALYALYKTDVFDRAASMSGSLWFPDFPEYIGTHEFKKRPEKLYFSLGDREARTKNPYLKTVQEDTEAAVGYFRACGLNTNFELNPGNHVKDAVLRSAKGIRALLV